MDRDAELFSGELRQRLRAAGLSEVKPVSSAYDREHFGNGEATFAIGPLMVRIVRDRDEESCAVASAATPTLFHSFEDIEISMEWRSVESVISAAEPEPLDAVLRKLAHHFDELATALSGDRARFTLARIHDAEKKRRQAYMGRFKGKH